MTLTVKWIVIAYAILILLLNACAKGIDEVSQLDLPLAHAQSIQLDEDSTIVIELSGMDNDGNIVNYILISEPEFGQLSGELPSINYTPRENFYGNDKFSFAVIDNQNRQSQPATISIKVISINDSPIAKGQTIELTEDTQKSIRLDTFDDGTVSRYEISAQPSHGTISGDYPNLNYQPHLNYWGEDRFEFIVYDNEDAASDSATVILNIQPVNDAPIVISQLITTPEDIAADISVFANDVEGSDVTFTLVDNPRNGVLSGELPNVRYTPNNDFFGEDRFTFYASDDSNLQSATATIRINVGASNDRPLAQAQQINLDEDASKIITLSGSDSDGSITRYEITQFPEEGSLDISDLPSISYTPRLNYFGTDSLSFIVFDNDEVASVAATVELTINSINDAPIANAQDLVIDEDTMTPIELSGSDIDGQINGFSIVEQPLHGNLVLDALPNIQYTPNNNHFGSDQFTFISTDDSGLDSQPATVRITINPVNDAPTAIAQSLDVVEDANLTFNLSGNDVDGSISRFEIITLPNRGSLNSENLPQVTYTPVANYYGDDSFVFIVYDNNNVPSAEQSISLNISAVNDPPAASAQSINLNEDSTKAITLGGVDIDGVVDAYEIITMPSKGNLDVSGLPSDPRIVYTPNANYFGQDQFSFVVFDEQKQISQAATISLNIAPVNDAPIAQAQTININEDAAATTITLSATDIEDSSVNNFTIISLPSNGTLDSSNLPLLRYTPNANFFGQEIISFQAIDSESLTSQISTITINIASVNDLPMAQAMSIDVNENTSSDIILIGNDPDGSIQSYNITSNPIHGAINLSGNKVSYTPISNYEGPDSFQYKVIDNDNASSAVATVSINVLHVNELPVANNDAYETTGNVAITIVAPGLLVNDSDDSVQALTAQAGIFATQAGGQVTIGSDGSFLYDPPLGFNGVDSFTYRAIDGETPAMFATATASINVSGRVWFIDGRSGGGNGTYLSPFSRLADVNTRINAAATDIFYLHASPEAGGTPMAYADNIVLNGEQQLIGSGVDFSVIGLSLPATVPPTIIGNPSTAVADIISLQGNLHRIRGLNISAHPDFGTRDTIINGQNLMPGAQLDIDALSINSVNLGNIISLSNVTANIVIDSIFAQDSQNTALELFNVQGNFMVGDFNLISTNRSALTISGSANIEFNRFDTRSTSSLQPIINAQAFSGTLTIRSGLMQNGEVALLSRENMIPIPHFIIENTIFNDQRLAAIQLIDTRGQYEIRNSEFDGFSNAMSAIFIDNSNIGPANDLSVTLMDNRFGASNNSNAFESAIDFTLNSDGNFRLDLLGNRFFADSFALDIIRGQSDFTSTHLLLDGSALNPRNEFISLRDSAIRLRLRDALNNSIVINNSDFIGNNQSSRPGIDIRTAGQGNTDIDISSNQFSNLSDFGGTANIYLDLGGSLGSSGPTDSNVRITNNEIHDIDGYALHLEMNDGSTAFAEVVNNFFDTQHRRFESDMFVLMGTGGNYLCMLAINNIFDPGGRMGFDDGAGDMIDLRDVFNQSDLSNQNGGVLIDNPGARINYGAAC